MKKILTQWDDPVFGYVPESHRDFYILNSGTTFNPRIGTWAVTDVNAANTFQEEMGRCRNHIISVMHNVNGSYAIGHTNIFDLMRYKATKLKYTFEGQEFIKILEI